MAADLALNSDQRVQQLRALLHFAEALAIALCVSEIQRIGRSQFSIQLIPLLVIQSELQPLDGAYAPMIAASRTDAQVLFHLALEQHFFADLALHEQSFRSNGSLFAFVRPPRLIGFLEP